MSKQGPWEYRVRRVTDNLLRQEPPLGTAEEKSNPGPLERNINELVAEGWELMPMSLQTAMGNVVLVFRRPKETQEEGGVYMEPQ